MNFDYERDTRGFYQNDDTARRYHQMFIPRFVERARKTAPAGADVRSWCY